MPKLLSAFLILLFPFTLWAQNWAPLPIAEKAYFLVNDTLPGVLMIGKECIANKFDSIVSENGVTYCSKKWTPSPLFGNIRYQAWDYLGAEMVSDFVSGSFEIVASGNLTTTLRFYSKRNVGEVVMEPLGLLEAKKDTLIQGLQDSVMVIRLQSGSYSGKRVLLSKNQGLLEFPSFSTLKSVDDIFIRHFERPGKKYDFSIADKKPWRLGDELHYQEIFSSTVNTPPPGGGSNSFRKVAIKCVDSTSAGLKFLSMHEGSSTSGPFGNQTTTITPYTETIGIKWPYLFQPGITDSMAYSPIGELIPNSNILSPWYYPVKSFISDLGFIFKYCSVEVWDGFDGIFQTSIPFLHGTYVPYSSHSIFGGGSRMADTFPVYYKSTTDTIGQALVFTSVKTQNTPNALAVYPNPTSDVLYMELDGIAGKSLQIWDAQGKSIKFLNGSNLGRLNVLDLKPGLYNLKMVLENGKTRLGRFVKE